MSTMPTPAELESLSATGGFVDDLRLKLQQQAEGRELFFQDVVPEEGGDVTVHAWPRTQVMDLIYDLSYPIVKIVDDRALLKVKSNRAVTDFFIIIQTRRPAAFIGKHGQTLDAVETLICSTVSKRFPNRVNINVDVDNYRRKRQTYLEGVIKKIVREIERDHRERPIPDLLPKERKFVHQFFSGHPYLATESRGEGSQRMIYIQPRRDIVED